MELEYHIGRELATFRARVHVSRLRASVGAYLAASNLCGSPDLWWVSRPQGSSAPAWHFQQFKRPDAVFSVKAAPTAQPWEYLKPRVCLQPRQRRPWRPSSDHGFGRADCRQDGALWSSVPRRPAAVFARRHRVDARPRRLDHLRVLAPQCPGLITRFIRVALPLCGPVG